MSQPHHFVFIELEREIRSSITDNTNLVTLLVERNVLREVDRSKFTGKNGMKCLTSYIRIKDFETFVTFTQCIHDVGVKDTNVDVSILETIRGAIRTFDENHCTHFEDRIPHLKASLVQDVISAESVSPVRVLKDSSSTSALNEMDVINLVSGPIQIHVGPEGGKLSSPITDFEIDIPPGAVKDQLILKAGTCAYGKFQLRNDVYRISDFICVTTEGKLTSPATVHIAHCLSMPEYRNTSAIAIFHSDMSHCNEYGVFVFSLIEDLPEISTEKPFISFKVTEFCIFCAVYRPSFYRGVQKQTYSSKRSVNEHTLTKTQKGFLPPYVRPHIPKLDYVLLFYERNNERKTPYQIRIYACVNCPGAIELCKKRMKEKPGSWKTPISKNFDFTASKIIFMGVQLKKESEGWEVTLKKQYINECDIQKPSVIHHAGKKEDRRIAEEYITDDLYPPSMVMDIHQVLQHASHLKVDVMIKDARDGNNILPDTYGICLQPADSALHRQKREAHTCTSNVLIKQPLSAEEEKCLEETVNTQSLARLPQYIRHWRLVASELSLSKSDVECLEYENMKESQTVLDLKYQILKTWYKRSSNRRYKDLVDALKKCEENETVNYIFQNIKMLSSLVHVQ